MARVLSTLVPLLSADGYIAVAVTIGMMALMMFNVAGPDLVLVAGLTALLATGVVNPAEAFVGFSSPAVITIAAMFVVAAGVRETGGLDLLARRVLGRPQSVAVAQLKMMLPVGAMSAFLNNTPVVAMFVPLISDWSRRAKMSTSLLLMPLSYAAILGGTCTLIGTSTNLVVAGMARARNPELEFGLFDITWLGLPALVAGTTFVVVTSRWLLKDRQGAVESLRDAREYTLAMRVAPGSPVIGQTIEDAGLRSLSNLFLFELERDGEVRTAVGPDVVMREGDLLWFTGQIDSVVDLRKMRLVSVELDEELLARPVSSWVEAVVAARSPLAGRSVKESRFRTEYFAAIVAVHRQGERVTRKVGDIVLRAGDVLLLEAPPRFMRNHQHDPAFALVAEVEGSTAPRHDKAWIAISIVIAMVVVNTLELLPLITASLLAAGLMLATRCLNGAQARRSLELRVLIAVAAAFGVGVGLDESGAAAVLAERVVSFASGSGALGLLAALYATTAVLAGVVSTTAAAALMFPIAASAAEASQIPLVPTALLIMVAASTSFSTPIGYQTNLMVYGPGGYRYTDFMRLGVPMQIVVGIVALTMAKLVYL